MSRPIKWSIPGIRKIYAVKASDVTPGALRRCRAGLPVIVTTSEYDVDFLDIPTCDVVEKHKLSGVEYSTTLRFVSSTRISDPEPKVWVVIDNALKAIMLGQKEAPYPRMEVNSASEEFSGRKAISYEIKCSTEPVDIMFVGF